VQHLREVFRRAVRGVLPLGIALAFAYAESNSNLTGRVIDPSDRPVRDAQILLFNSATLVEQRPSGTGVSVVSQNPFFRH
jgi:hypothetical protein